MTQAANPQEQQVIIREEPATLTPMDMLANAVSKGASIEVLEKLMALQERYERNTARKAFDEAVANAKAEIPPIGRNREGHNKKKYADFAAIAKVIDPVLAKNGLSYRFNTTQTERISVTCILSHRAGHSEQTTLSGPADQTGNKNAIQAIGSTLTYLQRYSLVQMLGIAAADDDDGQASGSGELTPEQIEQIQARIVEVGADIGRFCAVFGIQNVEGLSASQFDVAMAKLATFAARTKKVADAPAN